MKTLIQTVIALMLFTCTTSFALSKAAPIDFAQLNQYSNAQLSPDGTKLSVRIQVDQRWRLAIFDINTFDTIGGANLGGNISVGDYYWANNERLVIEMVIHEPWLDQPVFRGELFAVDYDGTGGEVIYGYRAGEQQTGSRMRKKESVVGWGQVLNLLPNDEKHILISSTPASKNRGAIPTVHKLNIVTGVMSKALTYAPIPYTRFVTSKEGELLFATGVDKNEDRKSYRYVDGDWQEFIQGKSDSFTPLITDDAQTKLYYLDREDGDKLGLYSKEYANGKVSKVYSDAVVDITDIVLSSDRSSAYAIRVDDGYPAYMMFNTGSEEAAMYKSMIATFPGYVVNITSRSDDGRLWLIHTENDISPGSYYLYDKKVNKLQPLFSNMSHIEQAILSEKTPFSFAASDGMTIHGYVTYPVTLKEGESAPLVTLVHGGPHGPRDWWEFDREVQMLAANGYAVAQVNFRGSGGYGEAFEAAGYKQWGDRIQKDIIEGTEHIIAQGKVKKDKVCIMGASFGGYSAVMSASMAPDLFKCAIANAGVYDLELLYSEGDIKDLLWGTKYLERAVGKDEAQLKEFSPVNRVASIKAPVLIAHGEKDRRVPFEHAEALRKALRENNKPYKWFVKPAETHGFFDVENRTEYFEEVLSFLDANL
ncbi:alpha/beta hydrolase family protein [Glaciecola siphonariae]|uniref:Alpha/beta hydrolase family protein n=1 Tax=Glaciecola siphonariae TaxID=521012 RepID=A0ABV9LXE1_9ALTE